MRDTNVKYQKGGGGVYSLLINIMEKILDIRICGRDSWYEIGIWAKINNRVNATDSNFL